MEPQRKEEQAPRASKRRRFTQEERRDIVERYRAGGLSQVELARVEGIAVATLRRWLAGKGDHAQAGVSRAVEFGRLGSLGASGQWAEIVRPDGWRVRLSGRCESGALRVLFSSLPPCSN